MLQNFGLTFLSLLLSFSLSFGRIETFKNVAKTSISRPDIVDSQAIWLRGQDIAARMVFYTLHTVETMDTVHETKRTVECFLFNLSMFGQP